MQIPSFGINFIDQSVLPFSWKDLIFPGRLSGPVALLHAIDDRNDFASVWRSNPILDITVASHIIQKREDIIQYTVQKHNEVLLPLLQMLIIVEGKPSFIIENPLTTYRLFRDACIVEVVAICDRFGLPGLSAQTQRSSNEFLFWGRCQHSLRYNIQMATPKFNVDCNVVYLIRCSLQNCPYLKCCESGGS